MGPLCIREPLYETALVLRCCVVQSYSWLYWTGSVLLGRVLPKVPILTVLCCCNVKRGLCCQYNHPYCIVFRVSSKQTNKTFVRTETNRNSTHFGWILVSFAKPINYFFGLFRSFGSLSKQPKQTDLFRNKPLKEEEEEKNCGLRSKNWVHVTQNCDYAIYQYSILVI
jgi:hypothetical protein